MLGEGSDGVSCLADCVGESWREFEGEYWKSTGGQARP